MQKREITSLAKRYKNKKANIHINDGDVAEVNSKKHLPLQVMDVVLGSMCFRLNDKHKERGIDGRRAKRNIAKELPYLHWNFVPKNFTKNDEFTKRHKTETAPYNLHK